MTGTRTPSTMGSVPSSRSSSRHRSLATSNSTKESPPSQTRRNPFNLLFHVLEPLKTTTNSRLGPRLRHSLLKCDALLLSGLQMVYMFIATLLGMVVTVVLLLALLVVLTAVMMPVVLSLLLVVLRRRSGRMLARLQSGGADRFAVVVVAAVAGAGVVAGG